MRDSCEYNGISSILPQAAPLNLAELTDFHTTGMPAWLQFSYNNRADSWRNIFYALSQTTSSIGSGGVDCVGGSLCITAEGIAESLYLEVMGVKVCPHHFVAACSGKGSRASFSTQLVPLLVLKYSFTFHSETRLRDVKRHAVPALHLNRCVQYLQINELMLDKAVTVQHFPTQHSMYRVSFAIPFVRLPTLVA